MKSSILFLLLTLLALAAFAHGGKKHKKDSASVQHDSTQVIPEKDETVAGPVHGHAEDGKREETGITAELSDFPTLHPMIVHFAIVLIIVAAVIQLLNIFLLKKEIAWIVGGLVFTGFLAAWFASRNFHPHTHGLSEHAKLVLEQHDKWADWTINTAVAGLIAQIIYLIYINYRPRSLAAPANADGTSSKLNLGIAIATAVILAFSGYCVAKAGHYGAQLVHLEGIGPQGKFLETEHDD